MLKHSEKFIYILSLPALFGYMGYRIYRERRQFESSRETVVSKAYKDYAVNNSSILFLENFKKKVFLIGVSDENPEKVVTVRNLIRDVKPNSVILELCPTRYKDNYENLVTHPNYERAIKSVNLFIDKNDIEGLKSYKYVDLKNMEYLVAMDLCSYRLPYCKTILGDRSYTITQKRLKSKLLMNAMLQEENEKFLSPEHKVEGKEEINEVPDKLDERESIPSITEKINKSEEVQSLPQSNDPINEENATFQKIRNIIRTNKPTIPSTKSQELIQEYQDTVLSDEDREFNKKFEEWKQNLSKGTRSFEEIYQQVVIDEINEELYNNAIKAEGNVNVMLVNEERLKSFEKYWKNMNLLFYEARKADMYAKRTEKYKAESV